VNNLITGSSVYSAIFGAGNEIANRSVQSFIAGAGNRITGGSVHSAIFGAGNGIHNGSVQSFIGGTGNLIATGSVHSAAFGAGNKITETSSQSFIAGGGNLVTQSEASAIFGRDNTIASYSDYSFISGYGNSITNNSYRSSILGGRNTIANDSKYSFLCGGYNIITDYSYYSSILGGYGNIISNARYAAILGGYGLKPVADRFAVTDRLSINSRLLLLGNGTDSPPDKNDILMVESLEALHAASGGTVIVPKVKWSSALTNETDRAIGKETDLQMQLNAHRGQGGALAYYDFGVPTNEVALEEFLAYAMPDIWGTGGVFAYNGNAPSESTYILNGHTYKAGDIFSATWVHNAFDNHMLQLVNTPDTNPPIFEIVDIGQSIVSQATNDLLGIVKGSAADMKVSVDGNGEMSVNGLNDALAAKQGKLIPGDNITMEGNVISTTGDQNYTLAAPSARAPEDVPAVSNQPLQTILQDIWNRLKPLHTFWSRGVKQPLGFLGWDSNPAMPSYTTIDNAIAAVFRNSGANANYDPPNGNLNDAWYNTHAYIGMCNITSNGPVTGWFFVINMPHRYGVVSDGENFGFQMVVGPNMTSPAASPVIWSRARHNSTTTWGAWKKIGTDFSGNPSQVVLGDGSLSANADMNSSYQQFESSTSNNSVVTIDITKKAFHTIRRGNWPGIAFSVEYNSTVQNWDKLREGVVKTFSALHDGADIPTSSITVETIWLDYFKAGHYFSGGENRRAWPRYKGTYDSTSLVFCFMDDYYNSKKFFWAEACG